MASCDEKGGVISVDGRLDIVSYGTDQVGGTEHITTPFISKDVEYIQAGERWIIKEQWTLSGKLLNCAGYADLLDEKESLIAIFSQDYQTLSVKGIDKALNFARLVSIDFAESLYIVDVDYTIVLEGYRNIEDLESDRKVINPKNEYSWEEQDDAIVSLTHTISAEGVMTTDNESDALANAKAFVGEHLLDGDNPEDGTGEGPYIISMGENQGFKRYLESQNETIDRLTCTYQLTRVYKASQKEDEYSILRYTSEVSEPFTEEKVITFGGTITLGYYQNPNGEGGDAALSITDNMSLLRDRYYAFKKNELIDPVTGDPIPTILSENVEEDQMGGVLTFTIMSSYKDICRRDYDIEISESAESSLIGVNVNGSITAHGACGWEVVSGCFYGDQYKGMDWGYKAAQLSKINYLLDPQDDESIYGLALSGYNTFIEDNIEVEAGVDDKITLNPYPLSFDVSENPADNTITFSASFDDRKSWGAHKVDYTMNVTLPVKRVVTAPYTDLCNNDAESSSHDLRYLGIGNLGSFSMDMTVDGATDEAPLLEGEEFTFFDTRFKDDFSYNENPKNGLYLLLSKHEEGDTENKLKTFNYEYKWSPAATSKFVNDNATDYITVTDLYFK